MLLLKCSVLFLHIVESIATGIGLGYLRQIQKSYQAAHYYQNNGIADGSDGTLVRVKTNCILVPPRKALPAQSYRT